MSGTLSDPFPHAALVTISDTVDLPVRADALLLLGLAATTATIKVTTAGGETLTIPFSIAALPALGALLVPIQVTRVWSTGTTGVTAVVALWH